MLNNTKNFLMITLKNKKHNHTGLSAINLRLNNYLVSYRYNKKAGWPLIGEGYFQADGIWTKSWYRKKILKALITGWRPFQCKVVRKDKS